jgi:hypothetical protein
MKGVSQETSLDDVFVGFWTKVETFKCLCRWKRASFLKDLTRREGNAVSSETLVVLAQVCQFAYTLLSPLYMLSFSLWKKERRVRCEKRFIQKHIDFLSGLVSDISLEIPQRAFFGNRCRCLISHSIERCPRRWASWLYFDDPLFDTFRETLFLQGFILEYDANSVVLKKYETPFFTDL